MKVVREKMSLNNEIVHLLQRNCYNNVSTHIKVGLGKLMKLKDKIATNAACKFSVGNFGRMLHYVLVIKYVWFVVTLADGGLVLLIHNFNR